MPAAANIEFIGLVATQNPSESHPRAPGQFDLDYLRAIAAAHEQAGFDRVLLGYGSTQPDGLHVGTFVTAITERLHVMLAHRPGFVAPTLAARTLATIDQLSRGRASIHVISGASDAEQQRDGDFLDKQQRYERSDEFITLLRRLWSSNAPFDHDGVYYRFRGGSCTVKPVQQPHPPIFFGGSSDIAIEIAGRQADVYALMGESLAQVREKIARVRAVASAHGRKVEFSVSFRPILAATEEAAWRRADAILARVQQLRAAAGITDPPAAFSVGAQRLLELADRGDRHDERLWTGIAKATGGNSNTTALVGTPEQVAASLLAYYDLGVSRFLLRGFDPIEDAIEYGRDLFPLVRGLIETRRAAAA